METCLARAWIQSEPLRTILGDPDRSAGREGCGVLLGRRSPLEVRIEGAIVLPNEHPEPTRGFRIDPEEVLRATRDGRAGGARIVGYWHAHPVGPPVPSQADLEGMGEAACVATAPLVFLVVGAGAGRTPVVRAWRRGDEGVQELPLGMARGAPPANR